MFQVRRLCATVALGITLWSAGCEQQREPAVPPQMPEIEKESRSRALYSREGVDPLSTLDHLPGTDPKLRLRIDRALAALKKRDNLDSSEHLAGYGKAAFPRILGAMAGLRDRLATATPAASEDLESQLSRLDACLRDIDGHLSERRIGLIRPGIGIKYVVYVCRLHYARWNKNLRDLSIMPGPFDPECMQTQFPVVSSTVDRFLIDGANAINAIQEIVDADQETVTFLKRQRRHYGKAVPQKLKLVDLVRSRVAAVLAVGIEHEDVWVRTVSRDCLRVLYRQDLGFEPGAKRSAREALVNRWWKIIEEDNE